MIAVSSWSPRRRLTMIAALLVAIALAITLALLLTGPAPDRRTVAASPTVSMAPMRSIAGSAVSSVTTPSRPDALPPLARTDDPAGFAREVADALFDVEPATVTRAQFLRFWRGELPTVVYSDAARQGLTLAEQNADAISNLTQAWIPPADAWHNEAENDTTSRLTITSISVPDYWVDAVSEGKFRDPGLHMERVMGVLHQDYGTDPSDRHSTARAIVIDLALLCGPTQPDGCRLLAPQLPSGTRQP